MPAVGSISTNLSLKDVAGVVRAGVGFLRTTGFFVEVITLGFAVPVTFGFGATGLRVTALRVVLGAGATAFFSTGPLPLRPSITIFPSWV